MEANKKEGVAPSMQQDGSNDERVLSHVTLNNNNDLQEFNLPSLPLSPPPVAAFGFHDVVVMASKDSLTVEELSKKLSVDSDLKSSCGGKGESKEDQCNWKSYSPQMGASSFVVKRVVSPEELLELAKVDPKKAKRILANRISATKSKERKKTYAKELEGRVKKLQALSDMVDEQLAICKRNIATRIALNNQFKMQIEALGQQLQQKCALREAMRKELEYYMMKNNEYAVDMVNDPSSTELVSKFSSMLALLRQCPNPSYQHQGTHLQQQISMPPLPPSNSFGQAFNEQCGPSFYYFNQLN
ncbi:hypothetical protein TanjilG_02050 [Lupinus angustifolius]|uniref:transcription factor RF2b-like n=1 Tax=Lupinus angustifolius TaxID=3871 RepID=UPI00090EA512|nr:PREDICTED: transcription factor RF2b-like [Lupinus angustifolius]OIV91432.1 hypothetical protein TanjilG_02050 [Lupinus angustifolius]